jgi:hypothetical protein
VEGGEVYEINLPFEGGSSERTAKLTAMLELARTSLAEKSKGVAAESVALMKTRSKLRGAAE